MCTAYVLPRQGLLSFRLGADDFTVGQNEAMGVLNPNPTPVSILLVNSPDHCFGLLSSKLEVRGFNILRLPRGILPAVSRLEFSKDLWANHVHTEIMNVA
jgi:hypothetical protein